MKLDLKQPKYVLPVLTLPFLCLFFYVFHQAPQRQDTSQATVKGLNANVGDVAGDVRKRSLSSKLDAFRNTYKETGGMSAVNAIPAETTSNPAFYHSLQDERRLDSLNQSLKSRYAQPGAPPPPDRNDRALAAALTGMRQPADVAKPATKADLTVPERDPMELFRRQMAYMDSITKENDPAAKAEKQKRLQAAAEAKAASGETRFKVIKATADDQGFNTVRPETGREFIKAIVDENVTGYAGSRIRLRLLEDIKAGGCLIPKGASLYASVTGFSGQRVTLQIQSIMLAGKILPVKLQVYDLDGLPGLYVPESAFRDFTKDLSGNTMQGVSIDGATTGSQFIMSSASKMFQSASSAIAELIRKNKARLKYSSYIYLIDADELQAQQKNY